MDGLLYFCLVCFLNAVSTPKRRFLINKKKYSKEQTIKLVIFQEFYNGRWKIRYNGVKY